MARKHARAVIAASTRRKSAVALLVDQMRVTTTLEDALRIKADMTAVQTNYEASIMAATHAKQARNDTLAAQLRILRQRPHPN